MFLLVFTGETFDQLALFSDGEVIGQIAASLDVRAKGKKYLFMMIYRFYNFLKS